MSDWISVKERLPEHDGCYIVTFGRGYVFVAEWRSKFCELPGWTSFIGRVNCDADVIAWMEFPEAYKEEKDV